MQHTNSNTKHSNVMQNNSIKIIAHNYCMGETNWFNINNTKIDKLSLKQLHHYLKQAKVNTCYIDIDDFRIYTIPLTTEFTLKQFINEAFNNMIRDISNASGDDQCFDYIPAGLEEFSSILQVLLKSQIQDIPQTSLDLYEEQYNACMQSFDGSDESTHYIDTNYITWELLLNATFEFPAIIL